MIPMSKWSLQLYIRCPKLFKAVRDNVVKLQESPSAVIGKSFHQFAYHFFVNWLDYDILQNLVSLDDVLAYYSESLEGIENPTLLEYCKCFLKREAERWLKCRDVNLYKPVLLEHPLTVELSDFKFIVIVDRVDREDSYARVWEYKTGYVDLTSIRRETALYACLINKAKVLDVPVTHWACFNPAECTFYSGPIHINTIRALNKWLNRLKESFEKDHWPKKMSPLCARCPLALECSEEEVKELEEKSGE